MNLDGKKIAVVVEQMYQEMEFWYPSYRFKEAGASVTSVGPEAGATCPSKHAYPARAGTSAGDVRGTDFDAVVIPGGYAPDHMRRHPAMFDLVNAGATYVDEPVVCDGNLISSRQPDDLPDFCRAIIETLSV